MSLEDYKVEDSTYRYVVPTTVPPEEKVELLREFLTPYQEDYDFENFTNGWGGDLISYFIVWARFKDAPKLLIQIPTGVTQKAESKVIQDAWDTILQLSAKLEDRWNGSVYHVGKRRSLKCKKIVLEQFLHKYDGFQFSVNPNYDDRKALQVMARIAGVSVSLLLEYSTEKTGEEPVLMAMMADAAA